MASWRIRIPVTGVDSGRPSALTITQTAGATAGFVDMFLDNADIRSNAHLEKALEYLILGARDGYRRAVGGV